VPLNQKLEAGVKIFIFYLYLILFIYIYLLFIANLSLPTYPPSLSTTILYLPITKQGVELSHVGVLSAIISMNEFVNSVGVNFNENEVYLSFLPLAHIFDRWVELLYYSSHIGMKNERVEAAPKSTKERKKTRDVQIYFTFIYPS
jgi:hypothetical protein